MKLRYLNLTRGLLVAAGIAAASSVCAQDHTVPFSTSSAGVSTTVTNWGLDTCWASFDNMQRGLIYMGTNNVDIVRVGFFVDAPLTNNDVTPADKSIMQTDINYASMATAATRWDMNLDSSVDAWYQTGANTVDPNRWAAAISACQRYYNRPIYMVEGFNEPDYGGYGSMANLNDVLAYLQTSNNFTGTLMAGGSTLNDNNAVSWFNSIASHAAIGTTHCLDGNVANYVNFIQTVTASNAIPFNPEMHNVGEAIMGVNYGLQGGIWWGTAERARGDFVKACEGGQQLGYADDWNNWTAAAVYRAPGGAVQGFVGEAERQSLPTTYRFFAKDRDVFYDGQGPQRAFTVTTTGDATYMSAAHHNAERVVNISWGSDVQPAINGRYIIVNRSTHLVLQVPGSGTGNSIQLDQAAYTNGLNQQWDVNPLPNTIGGDYSYYSIKAAHSGVTADVLGGAYYDGAPIQQYNGGTNVFEQWILQYANNSYFKIRTKFCKKDMSLSGNDIVQSADTSSFAQQWRLVPVGADPTDFTAPPTVTGVSATANARSVQLNWDTNSAPDFAGYTVLRSTNIGGPYDIVARGLTNNAFTDNFANQTKTYYYVVKAVDKSLNSSGSSSVVNATPTGGPVLIAHYGFNGNLDDDSVNANNPIVVNGSPTFVSGTNGLAMNLDGASQYVMLPANMLADVTNFTVAGWVYWKGGAAWQRIFDFGNGNTQYLFLTPSSANGVMRFAITTNSYPAEQAMETSPLPTNQWVHVAVTYDGTTARLYTNGVLAVSAAVTLSPAVFNPALNYLGKSQYDSDPLFNGRLDDFYVYSYALSAAQIDQLITPSTTSVWDGGGANNNWSTALNWQGDVAPPTSGNALVFAGSTRTSPNMDGNYSVTGVTFDNTAGSFAVGTSGSTLTNGSGGIVNDSVNPETLNVPVTMSAAQTIDAAAGNLTLGSTVNNGGNLVTVAGAGNSTLNGAVSGSGGLTKVDSGTLTLGGNYTAGVVEVDAGRIVLAASNTLSGAGLDFRVGEGTGNTGRVDIVTGGSVTMPASWFFVGHNNGTGTLNVSGNGSMNVNNLWIGGASYGDNGVGTVNIDTTGTIQAGEINVGEAWNGGYGSGTVNLTNGTMVSTSDARIGSISDPGSTNDATFNQYGGSVSSADYFLIARGDQGGMVTATYNLYHGTVDAATNVNFTSIGGFAPSVGVLNVSGGTFYSPGGMYVGEGWGGTGTSYGTLNVSGTGMVNLGSSGLTMAVSSVGSGVVNLNGGTIRAASVSKGSGPSAVWNFNGGTLTASASSTNFMQGLDAANVQSGGAVIDTAGNDITNAQALLDGGGGGGLTKNGTGALTLSAGNTYAGNTLVNQGTLALSGNAAIANSPTITVNAGATFDVSGLSSAFTLGAGQTLAGNGTVTGATTILGTVAPGASIGTLTFGTAPAMSGTNLMEINRTNTPNADKVVLSSGTLTYGGTLTVTNIGPALQAGDSFQLFSAPGYGGSFAVTNLPALGSGLAWSNSLTANGTLAVVSTVSLVPTNIVLSVTNSNLTLSWPADHTGWRLQSNTNLAGTNWLDVANSTNVNQMTIPMDATHGSVFYRLVYP